MSSLHLSPKQLLKFFMGLLLLQAVRADTITFEGFADSTTLTTQYSSVTFTNAVVLTAGISLNEFEFPPLSGVNIVSDLNGPMTITFSTPVTSFSGYFTYLVSITLTAYDSSNNQVGSVTSLFNNNLALSGDLGSLPNQLMSLNIPGGITMVTITGDPAGTSFTMDDLSFSSSSSTPEPTSFQLACTVVTLLGIGRKLKKHQ